MKRFMRIGCGSHRGSRVLALLIAAMLARAPATARAADSPPPPGKQEARVTSARPAAVPEPIVATRWYGWQTLLPDATAIGLFAGAANAGSGALAWLSGATFVLGGPVVHAVHGHAYKALGSLGLRVGLPLAGAGIGLAAGLNKGETCRVDDGCPYTQMAVGALVGAGAAIAVDAAALGFEPVPQPVSSPSRPSVCFAPAAFVGPHRLALGAVGSF